jgi:predicted ATP-grasp superfamily ATP-dependent carboligase
MKRGSKDECPVNMNALVTNAENLITLSIIRSLGEKGIEVTGTSDDSHALCFSSKYCKKKLIYPSVRKDEKGFLSSLEKTVQKSKYDVLFTMWIDELLAISPRREIFRKHTRVPLPPHESLLIANDKSETLKFAQEHNISCPKTYFPENVADAEKIKKELDYPAVIKPAKGFGAKGLHYVINGEELIERYKKSSHDGKLIIQECIPLEGTIYGVEALFNADAKPRAVFVHKRIRQYPLTGGQSTMRESVSYPEIEKIGLKLLEKLNWYGVAMVEFKLDPRDDKPKLMEINPRFWGSIPLSIAAGVDFPYLLYRMETEGDIKQVKGYKTGVKSRMLLPGDIRFLISALRDDYSHLGLRKESKTKVLREFMRFWEKDLHYDLFSLEDPNPALAEIRNIMLRKVKSLC